MAKNKMKTKRAAAKRFRFTGTGKVKHKRCNQSTNKPLSRAPRRIQRRIDIDGELVGGDAQQIKVCIPYWKKRK